MAPTAPTAFAAPTAPTAPLAHVWRSTAAHPDDPRQYTATNTANAPLGAWALVGTVRAMALEQASGEVRLRMMTAVQYGVDVAISEAILHGWITKAA